MWFFISKPRPLSLGHRCQQKTENEACRGSFFCDSFSVLRAGKRNSLSGVTQFTWRETPRDVFSWLAVFSREEFKDVEVDRNIARTTAWLLAVRMVALWGPGVPRWFLVFRVWFT